MSESSHPVGAIPLDGVAGDVQQAEQTQVPEQTRVPRQTGVATLHLSTLPKTWLLDLDGTLVKHNGYLVDGHDTLLSGAREFLASIPDGDAVVILTSRAPEWREATETFLTGEGVRYDAILFGLPYGERILLNDAKPLGLPCAFALNGERDRFPAIDVVRDPEL